MTPEETNKHTELISKLIQKRKKENEAFKKLLSAIVEQKSQASGQEEPIQPSTQKTEE